MEFFEILGSLFQLAWKFFTDVPFFGTDFNFSNIIIALISFFLVVRLLSLFFWGNGHE